MTRREPFAMKSTALALVAISALIASGFYGWTRARAIRPPAGSRVVSPEPEKHKVTRQMLLAAKEKSRESAPPFRATAGDGSVVDSAELLKSGPFVLLFIKDGCPCSVEAERYFNDFHASYRGKARFFGVIDGDAKLARKWADANGVPFPILADPKHEIIKAYGAESSAYIALIDEQGKIADFWPGYSIGMLKDFNAMLAKTFHLEEQWIDTRDAPDELYSGCPFE